MVYEWTDKVVLITGAATGIGAGVVRIIMEEGVKHVAVLDIAEDAGIKLQSELNSKYADNRVKFYNCDITNEAQFLEIFETVAAEEGRLDVVINNAGIMTDSYSLYKKEIEINFTALVTGSLKAIEIMGKDKGGQGGTVINISSVAALSQAPVLPIYFGTKSAVLQFSSCLGMTEHYSKTGVRILTICFGSTDTPLLSSKNLGSFNKEIDEKIHLKVTQGYARQTTESAAQGVVDAYKHGESGSTWLSTSNRPVVDITPTIKKAYDLMSEHVFN